MENYTNNPHHQEQNRKKSRKKSGSPSRTPSQARASFRPSQQPRRNTQQQEQPRRNTQQVRAQQQTPRENTQQQQQRSQHKAHAKVVYRAYLSWVIMIVHAIAFVWMMFKVNWEFQSFEANQMYGPKPSALLDGGAKLTSYIVSGQWWRLITAQFQHAGLIHLALVELLVYHMGQDIETTIGHWRFGAIYFLSGLFGVMLSAIFIPNVASVGASGAIFGCIGAQVGEWFHYGHLFKNKYRNLASIIISSLIGLAIGLVPNIDNYFHIGGWICGVFVSIWVYYGAFKDHPANPKGKLWSLGALGVLIVGFIVAFAVIMAGSDAHEWCSACKYLNCVKSPLWDCSYNDCYDAETQAYQACD